jgi:hypothetical protein
MDKLQWFKFTPSDWMMGKIQRCEDVTQARFIRLCCLYWNKECELSIEDAEIEIDKIHFDVLVNKKIVSVNDKHFNISFLDEQFLEIKETSNDKSKSGIIGNLKRWHPIIYKEFLEKRISLEMAVLKSKNIATQSHTDNTPIATQSQNIADKTIQDNILFYQTDKDFLKDFNSCRKHYDNIQTEIQNLTSIEKSVFRDVKDKYSIQYFKDALNGFYIQKNMFPQLRLRPQHVLEKIETYYECWNNGKKQLFTETKNKPDKL